MVLELEQALAVSDVPNGDRANVERTNGQQMRTDHLKAGGRHSCRRHHHAAVHPVESNAPLALARLHVPHARLAVVAHADEASRLLAA